MVAGQDIAEFGDLWSLMYICFAEEMVESFGDEGRKTLIRAIEAYGRTRGLRLKARHEELGLPISLRSLFEHYDMPGHPGTVKERTVFEDERLVSYTYVCPYERVWRERGKTSLGLLYCQHFHHAMWQAYLPDLQVEIPEILTQDDPHCKFIVTQVR